MAKKNGGGNKPQDFSEKTGRYLSQGENQTNKTTKFIDRNIEWEEQTMADNFDLYRGLAKEFHKPFDTFIKETPKYLKQLKNAFGKFDFSSNTDEKSICKILRDGHVKSIVETKQSNGYEDVEMRKSLTNRLFGIYGDENLEDNEYEKYGYLDNADRAKMYGNCRIVYNKEKIKDRTTFTIGDSLEAYTTGGWRIPSKITNPSIVSFNTNPFSADQPEINDAIIQNIQDSFNQIERKGSFNGGINNDDYVELQFHGDVTLEDIDYIEVPKKNPLTHVIVEMAQRKGVKIKLK